MENYYLAGLNIAKEYARRGERPTLLLHSCCAPCSTAVIGALKEYFALTVLYYNPNIAPREEYEKRREEQVRLLNEWQIPYLSCDYERERFLAAVRGLEGEKEGGKRCDVCFALRLDETAKRAKEQGFALFCTTLTVSPHKNAQKINEIGQRIASSRGVPFLPSDFKKKDGFKTSVKMSEELGLYRQSYCGCLFGGV